MLFRNKKITPNESNYIVELNPAEADAIIARGTSTTMTGQIPEYDLGPNRHMQTLLNKLHGK